MRLDEQLIEIDGSCRDINFPDVDQLKAMALLEHIKSFCCLENATDSEGNNLSADEIEKRMSFSLRETITSCWKGEGLISQIQVFFHWINQSEIMIELTFFPDDIDQKEFNVDKFLVWLKPVLVALKSREYYVI